MANPRDTERLEADIFEFVRKSEEAIVDAGRKWAKAVGGSVPVEMPAVRELVSGVFDFTGAVLKVQREFAQNVVRESRSAVMRMAETSPRAHLQPTRAKAPRSPRAPAVHSEKKTA